MKSEWLQKYAADYPGRTTPAEDPFASLKPKVRKKLTNGWPDWAQLIVVIAFLPVFVLAVVIAITGTGLGWCVGKKQQVGNWLFNNLDIWDRI